MSSLMKRGKDLMQRVLPDAIGTEILETVSVSVRRAPKNGLPEKSDTITGISAFRRVLKKDDFAISEAAAINRQIRFRLMNVDADVVVSPHATITDAAGLKYTIDTAEFVFGDYWLVLATKGT